MGVSVCERDAVGVPPADPVTVDVIENQGVAEMVYEEDDDGVPEGDPQGVRDPVELPDYVP